MRLICGLLNLDGAPASEELLRRMAAQMDVPRLQPALRMWRDGPVGLAVLDFSRYGEVPSELPDSGAVVIAADVRLDEPEVLRRSIGADRNLAEDALLLSVLEGSGSSGLKEVRGDFAFASWDRNARRLTCGRDIFGIRPFAYTHVPGKMFAFASFPRALHGSGIVTAKIDEDVVARNLTFSWRADDCPVAGIRRLPAAHAMEVSSEGVELKKYWQWDRSAVGARNCTPAEAAQQLRRLVDDAVRCRLPRTGEIGAHLSGGLDSSAISVLAARGLREAGRTLHAYSFLDRPRNDIKLEDETDYVNAVLEQESGINWTPIPPASGHAVPGARVDIDQMSRLDDDDPENAVCARAEQQGVELILSGWGGDEAATFNGRGTFAEMFLRGRWRSLAREMSAFQAERGWSKSRILSGEVFSYLLPEPIKNIVRRVLRRKPSISELLGQSLSRAAKMRLADSTQNELVMAPDGRENRWRLITSPHIAHRTETWAQIGARNGLAFAFPLLDRRVVEFALSLPSEMFLRDGFRRRPFRDAMSDVLPDKVRLRHEKFMPFPGILLDIADNKDGFLAKIDALEKDRSFEHLIDFDKVRNLANRIPSPEKARDEMRADENPADTESMIATRIVLEAVAYLEQHGGDNKKVLSTQTIAESVDARS